MSAIALQTTAQPQTSEVRPSAKPAEDAEFTFDDLIDIINPLQHLPIVSTIYRAITGDEITPHARALGGGLYGGPLGVLSAGAMMAAEEAFGTDGETLLADMFGAEDEGIEVAAAPTADAPPSPEAVAAAAATSPATAAIANAAAPNARPAPESRAATDDPQPFTPVRPATKFFALRQDGPTTMPFRAADAPQFQMLTQAQAQAQAAREAPAAPAPAYADAKAEAVGAPARAQLSPAQNALLERFISGAQSGDGGAPAGQLPPADGATPEWFAARMQANLQKYAAAQAAAGRAVQ